MKILSKSLLLFLFFPSLSFADRLGSLTPNSQVRLSTQTSAGTPAGAINNVQYNLDGSNFGGDNGFQYDASVSSVTINGSLNPKLLYVNQPSNSSGATLLFNGGSSNPVLEFDTRNSFVSDYGESFKFQGTQFGRLVWTPNSTGGYGIYISSQTSVLPTVRYGVARNTGKHTFYGVNTNPIIEFNPVGNSSFTIPVYLSTLTVNKQLLDGSNSAGTPGYVFTSNGATSAPTWQASGGGGGGINNQNTLQSGATFYVSSGTVQGQFSANTGLFSGQVTTPVLSIPDSSGNGAEPMSFRNSGFAPSIPHMVFYPGSGTNVASLVSVVPKGTGYSTRLKAQLSVFNTDSVADGTNYSFVTLIGGQDNFYLTTGIGGTGTLMPLILSSGFGTGAGGNENQLYLATNDRIGINTGAPAAQLHVLSGSSSNPVVIIQGASSQSANLTNWEDSSNLVMASIGSDGKLSILDSGGTTASLGHIGSFGVGGELRIKDTRASGKEASLLVGTSGTSFSADNSGYFGIEIDTPAHFAYGDHYSLFTYGATLNTKIGDTPLGTTDLNAQLSVLPSVSTKIGQIIQGASSQSANLTQWQNSSGVILSTVAADGNMFASTFTAKTAYVFPDATRQITAASSNVSVFTGSLFVGLTSGSTFQAFVPTLPITLKNASFTVDVASAGGSGDTLTCGDASGHSLSVTSANAAAAGTFSTFTGSTNIAAGTTVYMRLDSGAVTKPQGNVSCSYVAQ